jgi:acyl-CoA reductase-like NAD-dependent aldehyde dehydrogenase
MDLRDQNYVRGAWVPATGDAWHEVVNATTEQPMARVRGSVPADVDRAVAAAREAFGAWAGRPVGERAAYLDAIQAGLFARQDEIARTIAQEVGTPLAFARMSQAAFPAFMGGIMANVARAYSFEETIGNSLVVREPIGVVACITPWNYPLLQIMLKVAPALAAGCTVVVKPSEIAPLTAYVLAEVVHAAGLPPGVFNLVGGDGPSVGEALAAHSDVDMVSFTGSTRAGRRVSEIAAGTVKRVALELGGKSANVLLDDADFEMAVPAGVSHCCLNAGQTCLAWTRMLVPRSRQDEAIALARRRAESLRLGDPLEPETTLGPLVSAAQRERVREHMRGAIAEGATMVTGGSDAPEGITRGFFVRPTVFANVAPHLRIAQDEVFGPVLSILPYDDEEEAIAIANGTIYGLSGAVWSADPARAQRVARRLRAGQVHVNGGAVNPLAPFGGYKQSGNGRELGRHGFEEFLELKALQS